VQQLGVIFALAPSHISLPRSPYRVDLHVGFFEACSAFTNVAACTRARSPSRDRIQRQLLRLQNLIGLPAVNEKAIPTLSHRDSMPYLENLLVGVGFSLWRSVFQASQAVDRHKHGERARVFLNEIIKNNAAVYSTELNAWSLGYYLGNAQFRLLELHNFLPPSDETAELDDLVKAFQPVVNQVAKAPAQWVNCFHAFRLVLDRMEP
jgi:hypothetical protein